MPKHLPHRADLQSLRALAILLVLTAHANIPGMQGGYVGVDVFFVLSGYLISGLILTEIQGSGRFDAANFYARRVKRLFPALLVVLVCVALVAAIVASPHQQIAASAAAQAAALWLSNFYFAARTIDYFSSGAEGNLFLHTWSLAVEEQFYLIWPWFLLFSFGFWPWQRTRRECKRLLIGLAAALVISLFLSSYLAKTNTEAGFYLMPGRIWEFALGAIIFVLRKSLDAGPRHPYLVFLDKLRGRSIINAVGWLFALAAAVLYPPSLRYPGLWALLPCVGAALVLLDAPERKPDQIFSRFALRFSPIQFLGDISYSLYLWHWPVLVLGSQIFGSGWATRIALVLTSVILAALTYFAVERPIRAIQIKSLLNVYVLSGLGMALAFFLAGAWQSFALQTLRSPALSRIEQARMDLPIIYSQPCDTWYYRTDVTECIYGPKNASHTVVMFGDSVLAQWFPAFAQIYLKHPDWRLIVVTKSACPAQKISYYYDRIKSFYKVCDEWRESAIKIIADMRPDVIIMGSTHYPFTPEQWISGTRAVLTQLAPAANFVVIMSPTPELGFNGPDCLAGQAVRPKWLALTQSCQRQIPPATQESVATLLKVAASTFHNVEVIDLRDAICPNGVCHAEIGGRITYRDGQHLTAGFVQSLSPFVERALQQAHVPH